MRNSDKFVRNLSISFRDVLFGALTAFKITLFLLLPFINEPAKNHDGDIKQTGQMFIELVWDQKNNVDVDLLVKDPNGEVVFFRNPTTINFSLVRDDRGTVMDSTGMNFEHVISRNLPDGIYVVNAYVYSLAEGSLPVDVSLVITTKNLNTTDTPSVAVNRKKRIIALREEVTIARFIVINGKIKEDTITDYNQEILPILKFGTTNEVKVDDNQTNSTQQMSPNTTGGN